MGLGLTAVDVVASIASGASYDHQPAAGEAWALQSIGRSDANITAFIYDGAASIALGQIVPLDTFYRRGAGHKVNITNAVYLRLTNGAGTTQYVYSTWFKFPAGLTSRTQIMTVASSAVGTLQPGAGTAYQVGQISTVTTVGLTGASGTAYIRLWGADQQSILITNSIYLAINGGGPGQTVAILAVELPSGITVVGGQGSNAGGASSTVQPGAGVTTVLFCGGCSGNAAGRNLFSKYDGSNEVPFADGGFANASIILSNTYYLRIRNADAGGPYVFAWQALEN